MSTTTDSDEKKGDDSGSYWDCTICFDTAVDPVVTQCGHLFCWNCIKQVKYIDMSFFNILAQRQQTNYK